MPELRKAIQHKCEWLDYEPTKEAIEYLSDPKRTLKEAEHYIRKMKDLRASPCDAAIPRDIEEEVFQSSDLLHWEAKEWLRIYHAGPAAVLKAGHMSRTSLAIARKNAHDWREVAGIYDRMIHATKPEAHSAARKVIRQEDRLQEVLWDDIVMGV